MNLPGKIVLGYLGVGVAVAIARQVSHQNVSVGVSALDVLAWPYSVYQWATAPASTPTLPAGMRLTVGANRAGDVRKLPAWVKKLSK